ncbi:MAG: 6-bladed beta-propeller, partial [Longimicrobiales bacterium]
MRAEPHGRPAPWSGRRVGTAVLLGAALLAGCGACGEGSPDTSAGPAAPADTLVQTLDGTRYVSLRERHRLGGDDTDDASFYLVRAAALGAGGEVFVLDGGNHRVFVFGPEGTLLRAFGREGQGPGEFQRARHLAVRGDSVLVTDSGNRVHLFRTDGTLDHTRVHLE